MLAYPDRLPLAQLPTPLERLPRPGFPLETWFKRDDLTGAALSGNKVRKLEFLFAEARAQGADTVVTCGGEQSNHCRATAVAAAGLGLRSLLLLRTDDPNRPPRTEGNLLLDRLVGAEIRLVSRADYSRRQEIFSEVEAELRSRGQKPYRIVEGGSSALGAFGYIRCVEEMATQLAPGPATIVYAAGSGGTGSGLILGAKLLKLPWRIVGFNVCDDRAYFVRAIGEIVDEAIDRFGLAVSFFRDEIEIIDGYVGLGYAKSRPEELSCLADLARSTGLLLDPVYTGKAFYGLRQELAREPGKFGDRIVFIHTGGIFGLFAKATEFESVL